MVAERLSCKSHNYLKVVGPVVGDNVEAESVFRNWFHLAGQQVHSGRGLGLVRVVDVEIPVTDLTPPALPDVPQSALRSLAQVPGLAVAHRRVTLGLVQGVQALRGRASTL